MKDYTEIILGTTVKLNVHLHPIGNLHMENYDFTCYVYTPEGNTVTITKEDAVNDPGATQEYNWSIVITVAANSGVTELSRQIIVTDEGGNTDTCILAQAAGSATLTVNKTTIELDYQGTAQSFDITSNTSWTIS